MSPAQTPTAEQAAIIDVFTKSFGTGRNLVIEAGAGAGKTSTLKMMAKAMPKRRGLYVAYNRAIADDAKKGFPENVQCSTAHSLAYGAVGKLYRHRLNGPRTPARETARILRINEPLKLTERILAPAQVARLAMEGVDRFCRSADAEPGGWCVPKKPGMDSPEDMQILRDAIAPLIRKAWTDIISQDGQLKFTHDCQPPGTMVTVVTKGHNNRSPIQTDVKPIEEITEGDRVVSWGGPRLGYIRRAGRRVAKIGTRHFDGELITAKTPTGHQSSYTPEHICIAMIADALDGKHVVYMMRRGNDYRIGRTPWRLGSQGNNLGPVHRAITQGADALWVLSAHDDPKDAALAEALAQHRFNIPGWQFRSTNEFMPLGEFWLAVGGNTEAATACLAAHGRDIRFPLWENDGRHYQRRPIEIRACNLMGGMRVCVVDQITPNDRGALIPGGWTGAWQPVSLSRAPYSGPVYYLDVEADHTYVADGIVTHNCYLKLWQLSGPVLRADFVLLDEAQDANPVILDVVTSQKDAQLDAVGDRSQAIYCQPAGTMVLAVLPPAPVPADRQCSFGPCRRKRDHKGSGLCDQHERQQRAGEPLTGIPQTHRHVTTREVPIESLQPGDRVISYTQNWRLGAIRQQGCAVSEVTRRPYSGDLIRITTDSGYTSAYTPDHHCIVMLGRALRGQWAVYMARRGAHYRIGACEGRYESQGGRFGPILRASQESADAVWVLSVHDTREAALAAESAAQETVPGRCFKSFGGAEWWADQPPNAAQAAALLARHGLSISAPLVDLTAGDAILTQRQPIVTEARNLLDGMRVALADRAVRKSRSLCIRMSSWEPVKISAERYDGEIVSISVDQDHTYVADGIITHNSWRGAIDAMDKFPNADRLTLSQSFRFGNQIAREANKWLSILGAQLRITGYDRISSMVAPLENPGAILCRTNAEVMARAMAAVDACRLPAVVGGGDDMRRLAEAAITLKAGAGTTHPELMAFQSWGEVQDHAENDPSGSDLKVLVNLIDKHGPDAIIHVIDRLVDEKRADVVISTAHKAKGREWNSVKIASDFREPKKQEDGSPGEIQREEAMLAYVAVTRARLTLDRAGLEWVNHYLPGGAA